MELQRQGIELTILETKHYEVTALEEYTCSGAHANGSQNRTIDVDSPRRLGMMILGIDFDQWEDIGIALLIIILSAVIGRWLISFILDRMVRGMTRRTKSNLDDALVDAIKGPLFWLVLFSASQIAITRIDALQTSQYRFEASLSRHDLQIPSAIQSSCEYYQLLASLPLHDFQE